MTALKVTGIIRGTWIPKQQSVPQIVWALRQAIFDRVGHQTVFALGVRDTIHKKVMYQSRVAYFKASKSDRPVPGVFNRISRRNLM